MRVATTVLVTCLTMASGGAARAEEAVPPSPSLHADIVRLMDMTGARALGQQMAHAVSSQMLEAMRQARPELPDRAAQIIREVVAAELDDDGLWDRLVPIYARHFTHDEVKQMIAFYQTPLGKKTIEVMPQLMRDSMQAGQEWAAAGAPELERRLSERLKAEGFE